MHEHDAQVIPSPPPPPPRPPPPRPRPPPPPRLPPPPLLIFYSIRDLGVFIAAMDRNGFAANNGQLQVSSINIKVCWRALYD